MHCQKWPMALALLAGAVGAQPRLTFFVVGDGSCGEWVESRTDAHVHWLNGYLSGISAARLGDGDLLKGVSPSSALVWVDNYCRANPLEKVSQGANMLAVELTKRSAPSLKK